MRMKHVELLFVLSCMFVAQICAYAASNGKGVYKTYNSKKSLTAAATKKDAEKFLFNSMNDNSRAPAHDTPASPCKCSKYLTIIAINEKEKCVNGDTHRVEKRERE